MPHLDSLLENILTHGATGRGANTPTRRTPYEQGLPLYDPVMTHTLARTMEELRKHGYAVEKVEQAWNMYTRKRKDLFGMLDALALKNGELIGVQACSRGEMKAHEEKIRKSPYFDLWCSVCPILLMGWSKKVVRNKDGKKSKVKRWTPTSYYVIP